MNTITTPATVVQADLSAYAEQIQAEHQACCAAATKSLDHALRCGELLTEAKRHVPHGKWQAWLAEHFPASPRTARNYIRLANHREELDAKRQTSAILSIDEALKLIGKPRAAAVDATEFDEAHAAALLDFDDERSPQSAVLAYQFRRSPQWPEIKSFIDPNGDREEFLEFCATEVHDEYWRRLRVAVAPLILGYDDSAVVKMHGVTLAAGILEVDDGLSLEECTDAMQFIERLPDSPNKILWCGKLLRHIKYGFEWSDVDPAEGAA